VLKRLFGEWGEKIGEEQQKMVKHIPQYYKDNYAVHPIWWDPTDPNGRKVIFETTPLSEANRFSSAILWKLLSGKGELPSILDYGADMLPGLNPILTLAAQWREIMTGRAPRGIGISQTQVDAGAAVGPMARETFNQMSGGMLGRIPREGVGDVGLSKLERFLRLPIISNTLGRRIRVSNKGWDEGLKEAATPRERLRAQAREQAWRAAFDVGEGGKLSDEDAARLNRGISIMENKPDGTEAEKYLASLPADRAADGYFAERYRDYRLEITIQKLSPMQRAIEKAPWTQRGEILRGYGD